jgi:hypothetical protein
MGGLSIGDLKPITGFRLDMLFGKAGSCETEEEARAEDHVRAQLLRSSAAMATVPENRENALLLAGLLDYDGEPPRTPASKLYMRGMRERLIGHLIELCRNTNLALATVHLEPLRQELPGSRLNCLNCRAESQSLRAALGSTGALSGVGGAILFQDLEHEARTDMWRGGRHGLVIGDKVAAFDALRGTRNYRPRLQAGNGRRTSRVRIVRSISNLDYHLTYLFKGSFYGRWEGRIDGRRVRSRKRRIPGHRHSQALLWLHDQSVNDLCQLIGIRVGKEGFFFTNEGPQRQMDASGRP